MAGLSAAPCDCEEIGTASRTAPAGGAAAAPPATRCPHQSGALAPVLARPTTGEVAAAGARGAPAPRPGSSPQEVRQTLAGRRPQRRGQGPCAGETPKKTCRSEDVSVTFPGVRPPPGVRGRRAVLHNNVIPVEALPHRQRLGIRAPCAAQVPSGPRSHPNFRASFWSRADIRLARSMGRSP